MTSQQVEATIKEHLQELKQYLKPVALVFVLTFIAAFYTSEYLVNYVKELVQVQVITIHPYELLMTKVNIGFYVAIIATLPTMMFQVIRFFKPAMTQKEYRGVMKYIPVILVFSLLGFASGFVFLTQMTSGFLRELAVGTGIINSWTIANILSYMIRLSLAATIIFNIPLFVMGLVEVGVIEIHQLKQYRRHVIIGSVAFAALLSPPDLLSMMVLSAPTYGFYELGIKAATII